MANDRDRNFETECDAREPRSAIETGTLVHTLLEKGYDWQRSCELATEANEKLKDLVERAMLVLKQKNQMLEVRDQELAVKDRVIRSIREGMNQLNTERIDLFDALKDAEAALKWMEEGVKDDSPDMWCDIREARKKAQTMIGQIERRGS